MKKNPTGFKYCVVKQFRGLQWPIRRLVDTESLFTLFTRLLLENLPADLALTVHVL